MDLNAAVSDNLQFNIDRSIQETVLQFAQQRSSIFNIAKTYGLKIPGQRPSVALVNFSITVPAFGDREDLRYCGILRRGAQINGAGQVFETVYDIDFASAVNAEGFPNRLKIPNFDSGNRLLNYTIVKQETVVNGITKVFKRVITPNDIKPFFELFLPERNVLGVTSVLLKDGTQYAAAYSLIEAHNSLEFVEPTQVIENKITLLEHITRKEVITDGFFAQNTVILPLMMEGLTSNSAELTPELTPS